MLLTVSNIAERLGLCTKTVRNLIRKGELDGYILRIGERHYITRENLDKFIEDSTITA